MKIEKTFSHLEKRKEICYYFLVSKGLLKHKSEGRRIMKKFLAMFLALTLVLTMAACAGTTNDPKATDDTQAPSTATPTTEPQQETGTWNSVQELRTEEDANSVWQYYFFDPNDSSYNLMMKYIDHAPEGVNCAGWYPWEGSWVGADLNADQPGYLELNCEGKDAMAAVLGFVAPADGKYTVTGKVYNPWGQPTDLFTVAKNDGTIVTTEDISQYNEVNGYLTPTEVELKKGDILYFYCFSTADWVSSYSDITVYLNNTDPSILVKPEVVIPEKEEEIVPNVEGASHSATAEFSGENADGLWVYASTTDGVEYTVADHFDTPDWNDDNQPDAEQWYSANGTGLGFNYDVGKDWLEVNVTESAENGGEIMALGFKAPEAGTYTLTVFTQNKWGQSSDKVVVSVGGEDVAEIPFTADVTQQTVEVTLEAGQIAYIHGTSNGGWVSTYIAAFVA